MRARAGLAGVLMAVSVSVLPLAAPPAASAHPLGNFTINHFSRLTVGADAVHVLQVVDMAEIPALAERQRMDLDADDVVSDSEADAYLAEAVPALTAALELTVNGTPVALRQERPPRLTFPAGQAGLATLRLEIDLVTDLPDSAFADGTLDATFRDLADGDRLGWREIVVVAGAGARTEGSSVPDTSVSDALLAYPADGLDDPIDVREASFRAAPDAGATGAQRSSAAAGPSEAVAGDPIVGLLDAGAGGPVAALLAVLVSLGLGAAHAASPGHGKTLMAAYLIGARGTPSQAFALALTVAVTHTIGVFVLGVIVLLASDVLLPERVMEWLGLASGIIVLAMGVRLTVRLVRRRNTSDSAHHDHDHGHSHGRGSGHSHREHESLSGRSVALIGLAGGLVPSASALIVLLVAVSQAQMVLGIGLVVAFGAGMAAVLGGMGLVVVLARRRIERGNVRLASHPLVARAARAVPAASALTVLAIGLILAVGAVSRIA
jgi:nickel/cobalt transporter (NicO) family protein